MVSAGRIAGRGYKAGRFTYHRPTWHSDLTLTLAVDGLVAMLVGMSDESDSKTYEERAWQYFLQLQPSIADVNAAAELAFRAVDAFDKGLKRRRGKDS